MKSLQTSSRRISHKFARYRLRIGRSRIHRFGVFALEDIPAGQRVIEYTGRRLSLDQGYVLKPPHDDYLVRVSRNRLINGSVRGSGAEFINHSCDPNLSWECRRGHLFFYSRKMIRAGQELTMYFGYPTEAHRIPCICGARNCQKTLQYKLG